MFLCLFEPISKIAMASRLSTWDQYQDEDTPNPAATRGTMYSGLLTGNGQDGGTPTGGNLSGATIVGGHIVRAPIGLGEDHPGGMSSAIQGMEISPQR